MNCTYRCSCSCYELGQRSGFLATLIFMLWQYIQVSGYRHASSALSPVIAHRHKFLLCAVCSWGASGMRWLHILHKWQQKIWRRNTRSFD